MRVLVIDDDVVVARSIRRLLRGADDEVSIETDGLTGLDHIARAVAERDPFDLVLCDYNMRGLTGVDVLMRLHDQPERPMCILMSGYDDIVDAALVADVVLLKPFSSSDLTAAITHIKEVRERASTQRLSCVQPMTLCDAY